MNRSEKSQGEIEELPPWGSAELEQYLVNRGESLCPETLVYLYRELADRNRHDLCADCARLLFGTPLGNGRVRGGHCEGIIRRQAALFGVANDAEALKDFRQRCYYEVFSAIRAGREKQRFLEERFGLFLKQRAIDIGRAMKKDQQRNIFVEPDNADDEVFEHESIAGESTQLRELTAREVRAAVSELPEKEQRAAWLHWAEDYPVESIDPAVDTVSSMMGISGSMVRRHLRNAKVHLEKDRKMIELGEGEDC